jgi:hypothetical protein
MEIIFSFFDISPLSGKNPKFLNVKLSCTYTVFLFFPRRALQFHRRLGHVRAMVLRTAINGTRCSNRHA